MGKDSAHAGVEFESEIVLESIASVNTGELFLVRSHSNGAPSNLVVMEANTGKDSRSSGHFSERVVARYRYYHQTTAKTYTYQITSLSAPKTMLVSIFGVLLSDKLEKSSKNNERIPSIDALTTVRQIAEILAAADRAGISHQNLTPESILLAAENENVAIVNLGNPRISQHSQKSGAERSEDLLDYAAPEQLLGKPPTSRSSIYSLGIILYELLARHRPARVTSPWDIFGQEGDELSRGVPLEDLREDLAPETYHLVQDCLWQEEWNRFEDFDSMIVAIDRAIAVEQGPKDKGGKSAGTDRIRYMAISFFLLLFLMGFAFFGKDLKTLLDQPDVLPQPTPAPIIATLNQSSSISASPSNTPVETTATSVQVTPQAVVSSETEFIAVVELLAPLPDMKFNRRESIGFRWSWPAHLEPEQEFSVYLLKQDEAILLGTTTEPNDDREYEYHLFVSREFPYPPGTFFWQVILEDKASGDALAKSEPCLIVFLRDEAPTLASSPTPTVATTIPNNVTEMTDTPTPVCRPLQPYGWVRYIVKPGDSLSRLATQSGVSISQIQQANCLVGTLIRSGQTLWLPTISVRSTVAITPTSIPSAVPPTSEPPSEPPPAPPKPTSTPLPIPTPTPPPKPTPTPP